jgi:hypothetical protein
LSNQFWDSANIGLSRNVSYDFDYLDKKSIFFDETKTAEYDPIKSTLWQQKIIVLILELNFFQSILDQLNQ